MLALALTPAVGCRQPVMVDRFYQADGRRVYIQPWYADERRNRVLHGVARYWYRSGGPQAVIHYRDGQPEGRWTQWYENGTKAFTCSIREGEWEGQTVIWDMEGHEVCRGVYRNGREWDGSFYRPAPEGSGPAQLAGEIIVCSRGRLQRSTPLTGLSSDAIVALRVYWDRQNPCD